LPFIKDFSIILKIILGKFVMQDSEQLTLFKDKPTLLSKRQINILHSSKKNGTAQDDSRSYLKELGIEIVENPQPIQFIKNSSEIVHRWSPYVQGFSAKFVQKSFDRYSDEYKDPVIFDPFAGSGTVLVQSKLNNYESHGVELNPLLHFIAETKINAWQVNDERFLQISKNLNDKHIFVAPDFLKSEKHFHHDVLHNLEILKGGIDAFQPAIEEDEKIKNLMLVAFSSILIDCSNLKRTPCLGYTRKKNVNADTPFILFRKKINEIAFDLRVLQNKYKKVSKKGFVFLANSKDFIHNTLYDLVITSPPYMNGLDYVMNYKIEMGWLGFADNHKKLKQVKDEMVVCDNVSKGLIKNFSVKDKRYTNNWIEDIKSKIQRSIKKRGTYRRPDMPEIVHKYFDDMYKIMVNVTPAIRSGGRFILVIGDSLIADVYLPTDLLIAKIGTELGFSIEKIEKVRNRRSGQVRSYRLRETVVTLRKE